MSLCHCVIETDGTRFPTRPTYLLLQAAHNKTKYHRFLTVTRNEMKHANNSHFNIILSSSRSLPNGFFLSYFPTNILYTFVISSMRATCLFRLILLVMKLLNPLMNIYILLSVCVYVHTHTRGCSQKFPD